MARDQRFIGRRRRFNDRRFALQVTVDSAKKLFRTFPQGVNRFGNVALQRITVTTPEIRTGLIAKLGFIFNKLLLKEHAGFKCIQAQHALTKTMNGENGRFIHLPLGQQQPLRSLLLIRNLVQQARVEGVIRRLTQAGDAQLMNVAANTATQLGSGRFGEGYHQQLFHA